MVRMMIDITAAWESHRETVPQFPRRLRASEVDAEDLTQDIFLRLHCTKPSLSDADAVSAWLLHTVRNLLADHYRAVLPAATLEVMRLAGNDRQQTPLKRQGIGLSRAKSQMQRVFEDCCLFNCDETGRFRDYRERHAGSSMCMSFFASFPLSYCFTRRANP